jgi:TMEM175 potassium channel family protein
VSDRGKRPTGTSGPDQRPSVSAAWSESTDGRTAGWSDPSRAVAFSDGVFAIIITLLVLDLTPPDWQPGRLLATLAGRWPTYAAYVASYLLVGVAWINHAAAFRHIRRVDRGLNWINLAVLFTTGLLPFPTAVLARAMGAGDLADERIAVGLYGALGALTTLSWLLFFHYMNRHPALLEAETTHAFFAGERAAIGAVLYLGGALLGAVASPLLALAIFIGLPIFYALTSEGLPTRRAVRRRA